MNSESTNRQVQINAVVCPDCATKQRAEGSAIGTVRALTWHRCCKCKAVFASIDPYYQTGTERVTG
jgi:hypothetical protein